MVLLQRWQGAKGESCMLEAEARGLILGLKLAEDLRLDAFEVESDYVKLVKLVKQ